MDTKQLLDNQLEHFNTELMIEKYWTVFLDRLKLNIDTSKPFKMLDVGGGNGKFADRLLNLFPLLEITILDNSQYLLSQNVPHARKHLLFGSATMLDKIEFNLKFDIISVNWVLHHLVGDSRKQSLKIISHTVSLLSNLLTTQGYISIIENLYPGILIDSYPSRFIYFLTSIKVPAIASMIKRVGFNTAGVGVCFLSPSILSRIIIHNNLNITTVDTLDTWNYTWLIRLGLHTKPMRLNNIWIKSILPSVVKSIDY